MFYQGALEAHEDFFLISMTQACCLRLGFLKFIIDSGMAGSLAFSLLQSSTIKAVIIIIIL